MARTSYKRSSRPTGRKGTNAVGNLHRKICKGDIRGKPEYDREEAEDDVSLSVTVGFVFLFVIVGLVSLSVIVGLDPTIPKKHKALAHDMHAESIALQQRFVPQSVLRSSWLQLDRFGAVSGSNPCLYNQ